MGSQGGDLVGGAQSAESCDSCPSSSIGRGAGGTVCHPSPTPGGCGHRVGVVLPQEDREAREVRKGHSNNLTILHCPISL